MNGLETYLCFFSSRSLLDFFCGLIILYGSLIYVDAHLKLELLVKCLVWDLAAEDHGVPLNERRLHLANEIVYVLVQLRDEIGVTGLPILQVRHAALVLIDLFLEISWDAQSEVLLDAELGDVDRGSRIGTLRTQLVHVAYGINEVLL